MSCFALLSLAFLPGALSAVKSLPVYRINGYSMIDLEVGTPPVRHNFFFDTGSATTWIVADTCDGTPLCPNSSGVNRTSYNATASSTSHATGEHASIEYLAGNTSGIMMEDEFNFSGDNFRPWKQSFLVANESLPWSNIPADGFLGMAFSTIAEAGTTTLVENIMQSGQLEQPRFGLHYGTARENDRDETGASGLGTLTLGYSVEDTFVNGSLIWTDLSPSDERAQLWRVDVLYLVGTTPDNKNSTVTASGSWGIFDTGAGRISVPDPMIEEIYASIGMNWTAIVNGEHVPLCTEFTDAWSVQLNIGSSMSPSTLVLTGDMLKKPGFATGEDIYCWPPFDSSGSNGLFLFGTDFLRMHYTVFDFGGFKPEDYHARVGIGALLDEFKPAHL